MELRSDSYDGCMDERIYQRPREKLQTSGASSLAVGELLQLILGSGGSKVSVATLSRRIEKLITTGNADLRSLQEIEGVGVAKSCQIVAAMELSKRLQA